MFLCVCVFVCVRRFSRFFFHSSLNFISSEPVCLVVIHTKKGNDLWEERKKILQAIWLIVAFVFIFSPLILYVLVRLVWGLFQLNCCWKHQIEKWFPYGFCYWPFSSVCVCVWEGCGCELMNGWVGNECGWTVSILQNTFIYCVSFMISLSVYIQALETGLLLPFECAISRNEAMYFLQSSNAGKTRR